VLKKIFGHNKDKRKKNIIRSFTKDDYDVLGIFFSWKKMRDA
jgi:hypothetical protein